MLQVEVIEEVFQAESKLDAAKLREDSLPSQLRLQELSAKLCNIREHQ